MKTIWKEMVVAKSRSHLGIYLKDLKKNKKTTANVIEGSKIFRKILEPPPNSRRQNGDMKFHTEDPQFWNDP
jgi:hypothetical protein